MWSCLFGRLVVKTGLTQAYLLKLSGRVFATFRVVAQRTQQVELIAVHPRRNEMKVVERSGTCGAVGSLEVFQ